MGGGHRSRQKLETVGHVAHTGSKKIQALVCSWLSLFFLLSRIPVHGSVPPIFRVALPTCIYLV